MNIDTFSKHTELPMNKLRIISASTQAVLRYIQANPISGGTLLTIGGGAAAGCGPVLVGIGTAVAAYGIPLISVAVWIGGIGIFIGCLEHSASTVRHSLIAMGAIGGGGASFCLTGILMKVGGYTLLLGGSCIGILGICILVSGIRKGLRQNGLQEDAINRSIQVSMDELSRSSKVMQAEMPVYVLDLKKGGIGNEKSA